MAHSRTPTRAGGKLGTVHPGVLAGAESAAVQDGGYAGRQARSRTTSDAA